MPVYIRRLTATEGPEIDRVIDTLHSAFKVHPINEAFCGYDETLVDPGWRSALLAALAPESGEVWVAGVQEGDIDAACVSYGPGAWFLKNESERKMRDEMFNSKLTEKAMKWLIEDFVGNLTELHRRCFGENFEARNHDGWQVSILGTHPEKQGHGLGSALIRKMFELADAKGVETILETTTIENVRFYENLGFVDRGETVTIPLENGETKMWCMVREPAGNPK